MHVNHPSLTTWRWLWVVVCPVVAALGCGPVDPQGNDNGNNNNVYLPPDAHVVNPECVEAEDDDHDGISNGDEACRYERDVDGDNVPDYLDLDSDNDRIPDSLEAGDDDLGTPPVDTDDDHLPDFLDRDSDNDGVNDNDEDRNRDGRLGDCTTACNPSNPTTCTGSQHCSAGAEVCVDASCLHGETDPRATDTDGDGVPDGQEPTFICNQRTEDNPLGRKPVQYRIHDSGVYQLALEEDAVYQEITVTGGTDVALAAFDLVTADHYTAGFSIKRIPISATPYESSVDAIQAIRLLIPNLEIDVWSSGNSHESHDGYPSMVSTVLLATTSADTDPSSLRNLIYGAITGRAQGDFGGLPAAMSAATGREFIISFSTLHRPAPPATASEVIFMGAVARRADYEDGEFIGFHVDDAAGGTGLAEAYADTENECEFYEASYSVADIVWVIDESDSMTADQDRVIAATDTFVSLAQSYGLSWRNCVVDMTHGEPECCTGSGTSGLTFLDGSDVTTFKTCVQHPNGGHTADTGNEFGLSQMKDTIAALLPRADDSHHIRPAASLAVIFLTDEPAQELKNNTACPVGEPGLGAYSDCLVMPPNPMPAHCYDPDYDADCDTLIQTDYLPIVQQENAQVHGILVPASEPDCSDQGARGRGYEDLINMVGGQVGSICQDSFQQTMNFIIQDIAGGSSKIELEHVPITVSIAVAIERKDGMGNPSTFEPLPRSRAEGFDFRASSNRVVLLNQPTDFPPYQVVVSYTRWITTQVPPD